MSKLELKGITKSFPGVLANDQINLSVRAGEVVVLLGENGAGKTTLMNILYGLYRPDSGEILIDRVPQQFNSSAEAVAAGIGMVHQHLMLIPVLTVAENVALGAETLKRGGRIDLEAVEQKIAQICEANGLPPLDPHASVGELPVGVQQRIEIIKVLYRSADYVVFDEPTAMLTPQEVTEFLKTLKFLRNAGKGIIYITHKLKEALAIADKIVILRRGRSIKTVLPKDVTEEQLAELMVGRKVDLKVKKQEARTGDVVLDVRDLAAFNEQGHAVIDDVSFKVKAGEIVGIAGVQGNGQSELVETLAGMRPAAAGEIFFNNAAVTGCTPRELHQMGLAHIPEDRQETGLVLDMPVFENVVLTNYYQHAFADKMSIKWEHVRKFAKQLIAEYDVRPQDIRLLAQNLSGGNQQKVIIARELCRDVKLIIASQPTRGVDVGSMEYIHSRLVEQRDSGAAILLVSTELDEILALSDRVLIMYQGKIAVELPCKDATPAELGWYMAGGRHDDD